MKKVVLLGVLVFVAVVATTFLIIHRQRMPLKTHKMGLPDTNEEAESAAPAGIPEVDWRDHQLWVKTPEYKAVMDELRWIGKAGTAWDNLTPDQVEVLIKYMHSPHYEARVTAAIMTGGKYPAPVRSQLIPNVVGLLSDPVSEVRFWAADALGSMGDKSMIPFLYPLLNDERKAVAIIAQKAISKLEQEEAVQGKQTGVSE